MGRSSVIVLVGALIVLVGVLLWHGFEPARESLAPPPPSDPSGTAARQAREVSSPAAAPVPSAIESSARSSRVDIEAQFLAATNYLDFIRATRPVAEAGDAQAQLFLYRAFEFCRSEYPFYFRPQKREIALDEGLRRAATQYPFDAEYARRVHERCHEVYAHAHSELETAVEWLRAASRNGEPRAHASLASQLFRDSVGISSAEARQARLQEAQRLLGTALRSRHPEVIRSAGELLPALRDEEIPETEGWAWQIAACERGLDCGPTSERVQALCRYEQGRCQPYETMPDMMRRFLPAEYPAIEQRAREINQLIDAGDWEALGFGETISDN